MLRLRGRLRVTELRLDRLRGLGEEEVSWLWSHYRRTGVLDARLRRAIGRVVETRNLIVTAGKQHIADLLIGATADSFGYVGVGSGTAQPQVSDTDLEFPIPPRRQVTDRFRVNNIASFSTFFGSQDNNGTWQECGLFTLAAGGVMLARALFPNRPITKDTTVTEVVDWDIEVG